MQISVVGRHLELTEVERSHAEAEALKLARFFDGINEFKITFTREHGAIRAEVVCRVSGGATLVAVEKGRTIDQSLEFASDNMVRQIKKYKAKLRSRRPPPPSALEK